MEHRRVDSSDRDRRLDDLLAIYLEEVESGRSPDRRAWLARHRDFASELSDFFDNLDHVGRIAEPFREQTSPPTLSFPRGLPTLSEGSRVGYFGDYELIREIARGGMGVVYAARQVSLDRLLALKMIHAGPGTSEADLRRFRLEAEAVAHLDHPNIVPIYEVGEHEGHRYYSMKLVDGGTLATEACRLRGDFAAAARIVSTTARAIHYAHQRGILHRDLKPSNILFDRHGATLVADFGLAKRLEAGGDLTLTGSIVGTPSYMAPEQAEGRREGVTTAVDVYGLGAVLYEVLTGNPPFRGNSVLETLRCVKEIEPERPTSANPEIPRDLETICRKCLEKDPSRRYQSAEALADDLDRWLAGLPIRARPSTWIERAVKWAKRRPTAAALTAACVAAAGLGTLAVRGTISADRFRGEFLSADTRREKESIARQLAEAEVVRRIERESRVEADRYFDKITAAETAWLANSVESAERILDDCPPALRRWEWSYLRSLCRSEIRTIKGHSGMNCGVAFVPTTATFCCPSDRGGVSIWDDRANSEVCQIRGHDGFAYGVAFDAQGKRLATAGTDGKVRLWDVASGKLSLTMPGHGEWAAGVAFAREGTRLASGGADHVVRVWDTTTGAEVMAIRGHFGPVFSVAVRPDGKQIASASQDGSIKVWDAATGLEMQTLAGHLEASRCVAYSPDGLRLASGGADRHVRIWDLATGRQIRSFPAASGRVDAIAFSPDGRRLATGSLDRSVKVWDADSGRELASYRGHAAPVFSVAFSPDGTRLASAGQDATVKFWDATSAPEARVLSVGDGRRGGGHAALSRDGSVVATSSADGRVTAWDTSNGRKLWSILGRMGAISSLGSHPVENLVLGVGTDRTLRGWDFATGAERLVVRFPDEGVASFAVSPDGRRLATGGGEPIAIVQGLREKGVPESREARSVRIWDVESGAELHKMDGHVGPIHAVRFSRDGSRIVSAGRDGTVRLWEARSGRQIRILGSQETSVLDVAFSPDSARVVSASADGTLKSWDLASDRAPLTIPAHSGWASGVAFSPDGTRVVSSGSDGAVKLWDSETGREVLPLLRNGSRARGVIFSANGHWIAACLDDGTIRLWQDRREAR